MGTYSLDKRSCCVIFHVLLYEYGMQTESRYPISEFLQVATFILLFLVTRPCIILCTLFATLLPSTIESTGLTTCQQNITNLDFVKTVVKKNVNVRRF